MMIRKSAALLAAALALAGVAQAADPVPAKGEAKAAEEVKKADGVLTNETLEKMLLDMGYEPKVSRSADGSRTWYDLTVKQDTFTFVIDLSLADGRLWFSCPLKKVADPDKVPAEKLWKLLQENDTVYPGSFSYYAQRKQFFYNLAVENRDLTPTRLRAELDRVMGVLRRTYTEWDTSTWPGGPESAVKAQLDRKADK
jgi:hypothetical protein